MGNQCFLCPRACGARRDAGETGFCGMTAEIRVARAALHPFEEPPISGTRGSGTVFFAGCSLRCIYCQNQAIQPANAGEVLDPIALSRLFLYLQDAGAHNINLVTPTHYADGVAKALRAVKAELKIPVVYNCGGYESVQTLQMLDGLVDVYMPDFKYVAEHLALAYSNAPRYAEHATAALLEMYRQTGKVHFDENGMMTRGVLVRHLVLPGSREDSIAVLERIAEVLPTGNILLSLMRQYTPSFAPPTAPRALKRRVTSFEYEKVAARAEELGFLGFLQDKASAQSSYTPNFGEQDLLREFLHKEGHGAQK